MKKFDNFCKALDNLEDIYKYEEPYDNVVLTGLVALYEICFEQSWKAVKKVLSENGIEEQGTHDELINKHGIYYDLYNVNN